MRESAVVDVQKILRDRIQAIATESGVELKHVLFMVAQEHDDLSVFLDPEFLTRYHAFLSAMPNANTYRQIQGSVRVLLREIHEFGIDTYAGLCRDQCLRCGTSRPANGWSARAMG